MSSNLLQNFARYAVTLAEVLDVQQFADDLARLRESKFPSQRAFARKTNGRLSREVVRKIESGERPPEIAELIVWIETCEAIPGLWLSQYLSDWERKVLDRDRELLKLVRAAMKVPSRRKVIEALVEGWSKETKGNLARREKRKRASG